MPPRRRPGQGRPSAFGPAIVLLLLSLQSIPLCHSFAAMPSSRSTSAGGSPSLPSAPELLDDLNRLHGDDPADRRRHIAELGRTHGANCGRGRTSTLLIMATSSIPARSASAPPSRPGLPRWRTRTASSSGASSKPSEAVPSH